MHTDMENLFSFYSRSVLPWMDKQDSCCWCWSMMGMKIMIYLSLYMSHHWSDEGAESATSDRSALALWCDFYFSSTFHRYYVSRNGNDVISYHTNNLMTICKRLRAFTVMCLFYTGAKKAKEKEYRSLCCCHLLRQANFSLCCRSR